MHAVVQKTKTFQHSRSPKLMKHNRIFPAQDPQEKSVLDLQRTIGNRAVLRLISANSRHESGMRKSSPDVLHPLNFPLTKRQEMADQIIRRSISRIQNINMGYSNRNRIPYPKSERVHLSSSHQYSIQRVTGVEEATVGAILAWCASGAAVTLLIDEILQVARWAIWGSGRFQQNWCSTLFSALFGCVFGIAGGAAERMIFSEAATLGAAGFLRWAQRKLLMAGYNQIAGKIGLAIAKAGC